MQSLNWMHSWSMDQQIVRLAKPWLTMSVVSWIYISCLCTDLTFFGHSPIKVLTLTIAVDCSIGTYYRTATETCQWCQIGTYNDMTKQTECTPCEDGKTTELEGSTSINECFGELYLFVSVSENKL